MGENDPTTRLRFKCLICCCTDLLAVCADGIESKVQDLFPLMENGSIIAGELQAVYERTEIKRKSIERFCCGDCGFVLVASNRRLVRNSESLVNWLRLHEMIDE